MLTVKEDEIESITRSLNELRVTREETNDRFNRQERALHIQLARATGVVIPSEPPTVHFNYRLKVLKTSGVKARSICQTW